jgi:hypothetical protein
MTDNLTKTDQTSQQVYQFDQSPFAQAELLRKEARGTPAGVKREQLLRRARQIESMGYSQARIRPLETPSSDM